MKTTAYIDMSITSKKINVSILEEYLNLKTDSFHNIGDKNIKGQELDYSEWCYCSDEMELYYTSELTKRFYNDINAKINILKDFVKQNECSVSFCIVISSLIDSPALDICSEFIKIMAELNASCSFDNVYLS